MGLTFRSSGLKAEFCPPRPREGWGQRTDRKSRVDQWTSGCRDQHRRMSWLSICTVNNITWHPEPGLCSEIMDFVQGLHSLSSISFCLMNKISILFYLLETHPAHTNAPNSISAAQFTLQLPWPGRREAGLWEVVYLKHLSSEQS